MLTTSQALELTSVIVQDDETKVEPLIKLIAGMSDARGDPNKLAAVRNEVLRSLYSRTEDCRQHLEHYLGERNGRVIAATSSAS